MLLRRQSSTLSCRFGPTTVRHSTFSPKRWKSTTTTTTGAATPSPFDAIFVINLDHRTDRMASIASQLEACGIEASSSITRVPAVKGADADPKKLLEKGFVSRLGYRRLLEPESNRIWGMDLNPGAVGCALSHIKIWAEISARGCQNALVIEDDSLFQTSFIEDYMAKAKHFPPPAKFVQAQPPENDASGGGGTPPPDPSSAWDLIYLAGLDTQQRGHLLELTPNKSPVGLRHVPQFHRTTNCYITHAIGAENLLASCVPLTYQLDTQMTMQCDKHPETGENYVVRPRCYTLLPPLVIQSTQFGSDIQSGGVGTNAERDAAEEERRKHEAGW